MEVGLDVYRARFAGVETDLGKQVTQGLELIKELLDKLDHTETQLTKTKLDLESETETRRRLQKEAQENKEWRDRQERRPFMVALIDADADGYVFRDGYLTRGEKGGEDAADALLTALQQYMRGLTGLPNNMDILVRAFANVGGLGKALVRDRRLQDIDQLRAFATGFSNRQVFFDFVDVGTGKERADYKIQECVKFFVESPQCKHVVVACGHDTGYAPFLGQFIGDKQVAERITLLEGSPFPAVIKNLGLKRTRFASVFDEVMQPVVPSGPAGSASSNVATTDRPTNPGPGPSSVSVTPLRGYQNLKAQSERLGPVLKDNRGRRVDRTLRVNDAIVERLKKGSLCFYFFLRGECLVPSCRSNHVHRPLTDEEFDALWWIARQHVCYKNLKADRKGSDCSDARCIYGHKS
ncbi:uncharacterized protein Triagg1_8270 [Trichoderma aggressivum f. europaeum]|uniref:DUF7923 domain-containing protein n=1 Tax=Trichoderma aggressivum f. europaeum TaxID=173218 RepID=A0AAE1IAK4_9HYPO|nr:hypothetical protein Triagg1_8270 [Trichoderma aggressivum f. europaeum]